VRGRGGGVSLLDAVPIPVLVRTKQSAVSGAVCVEMLCVCLDSVCGRCGGMDACVCACACCRGGRMPECAAGVWRESTNLSPVPLAGVGIVGVGRVAPATWASPQVAVDPFAEAQTTRKTKYAVARFAYAAGDEGELSLEVGDGVWITKEDLSGWWYGRNVRTGADGWLPCAYVQPMAAAPDWGHDGGTGDGEGHGHGAGPAASLSYHAWSDGSVSESSEYQ
jgi:hypothetical protein